MDFPKEQKPIGYTVTRQEGDYKVAYEVVGWNEKSQCNVWAEKKRLWKPRPTFSSTIDSMQREIDAQYIKTLRKRFKE